MKIISWNVNGFRARKEHFQWVTEQDPDILCLQEVKAELSQAMPFPPELAGYEYVDWNPSITKKGYSGTSIFSKIKPIQIVEGIGAKEFDDEGRTQMADYGDFIFYNIYFPNAGQEEVKRLDYKITFNELLSKKVQKQIADGRNVIITGDYNVAHNEIDIARPKDNEGYSGFTKEERGWMDKFLAEGIVDTFRHSHPEEKDRYSWWNMRFGARKRNVGWRIDYFCVNKDFLPRVTNADILDQIMGSDHAPIILEFK